MLSVEEIRLLMANDEASQSKQDAQVGWRYYEGKHDIENRKIYFVNERDELEEDLLKSNIKISHPFHRELTDQVVQYTLSSEESYIRSDDPKLQAELDSRFNENEDFTAELYKMLTGVVAKGWDYMYAYKNEDDVTAFQHADSLGVVEVCAKDAEDGQAYLIYWYDETVLDKTIRRIQVWDEAQVTYYRQIDYGEIELDDAEKLNPRPHTLYEKGEKVYQNSNSAFGQIPFFRMDNFPLKRSDLFYYKDQIDDYDLMNCDLSNNLQDTNEASYFLEGFEGDNLDELMYNYRAKKAMGIPEGGQMHMETVDVPFEARKAKMDIDRENIYHFGQGLNMESLKDTSSTTNIAIKSAYTQLDSRSIKLKIALKQFLRKLLNIVLPEINQVNGTDYQQKDVYFVFDPVIPTNEQENAQIELTEAQKKQAEVNMLLSLATHLDNETMMKLICEQLEVDYEEIKSKLPDPEELDPYADDDLGDEEGGLIE